MTKLYGIANCDTMKKARAWLDGRGVDYRFHDYRRDGVDADALDRWMASQGWEALVNRRGTTFRKLTEEQRAVSDTAGARLLMLAHPSLIRRPVLEREDGTVLVGFSEERYAALFG